MINDHKQWLYKGSDGKIFERGEVIPEGWFDAPNAKEWNNMPVQPKMKNTMVWDDTPDVAPVELDAPVSDDAPEILYCAECDKEYKDKRWYDKHMAEKHGGAE